MKEVVEIVTWLSVEALKKPEAKRIGLLSNDLRIELRRALDVVPKHIHAIRNSSGFCRTKEDGLPSIDRPDILFDGRPWFCPSEDSHLRRTKRKDLLQIIRVAAESPGIEIGFKIRDELREIDFLTLIMALCFADVRRICVGEAH
jgi:hypothetical protein